MPLIATRLLLASLVLVGATACTPQSDPETGRSLAPSAGLPADLERYLENVVTTIG